MGITMYGDIALQSGLGSDGIGAMCANGLTSRTLTRVHCTSGQRVGMLVCHWHEREGSTPRWRDQTGAANRIRSSRAAKCSGTLIAAN